MEEWELRALDVIPVDKEASLHPANRTCKTRAWVSEVTHLSQNTRKTTLSNHAFGKGKRNTPPLTMLKPLDWNLIEKSLGKCDCKGMVHETHSLAPEVIRMTAPTNGSRSRAREKDHILKLVGSCSSLSMGFRLLKAQALLSITHSMFPLRPMFKHFIRTGQHHQFLCIIWILLNTESDTSTSFH